MKGLIAAIGGFGIVFFLLFGISFAIGAVLWPYTINTWLVYAGEPPGIEWWMGGLIGLVPGLGQFSIPAAVVTWITMLFLI